MAVRRTRQGVSATTYWLITFVFLFAISTALAILFYQQRAEFQQRLGEAEQTLNDFVEPQQREQSQRVQALRQTARQEDSSVVRLLLNEMERLKRVFTGQGQISYEQIQSRLRDAGVEAGRNVMTVLGNTRDELANQRARVKELQQKLQQSQKRLDQLAGNYEQLKSERSEKIAALEQKVTDLRSDYQSYQDQVNQQREDLKQKLEQARQRAEKQIRQRDNRIEALEKKLAGREKRIKELRNMLQKETPGAPDQVRRGDGRIIAVNDQENRVYINLGRTDHIVLGMTFEVFDPERGVQVGENGEPRGKATVEVTDVSENSAACRIVRSSAGRPILEDDVIANLVYDKDRTFKFYVFGKFDLDGDGEYTTADQDMVRQMVREWGGQVVRPEDRREQLAATLGEETAQQMALPLDTDFLVIGQEPKPPEALAPNERDPVAIRKNVQAKKRWKRYQQLTEQARSLSIPILNQNRFLALLGHYQR